MTRKNAYQYWSKVVPEAYRSKEQINRWCNEHGINEKSFHRWAKKLGYVANGERTVKYYDLIAEEDPHAVATTMPKIPVFAEVPSRILDCFQAAVDNIPASPPLITVCVGSYQVGIQDGFDERTLSKVLEVIRHA